MPNEDDYNNINPITYEGDFYQEEEDDGEFDVVMGGLEDLEDDAQVRGEAVVNIKDIDMLSKLHLDDSESDDEPPPFEGQPYYSHDIDSDYESDDPRWGSLCVLWIATMLIYVFMCLFILLIANMLIYVFMCLFLLLMVHY